MLFGRVISLSGQLLGRCAKNQVQKSTKKPAFLTAQRSSARNDITATAFYHPCWYLKSTTNHRTSSLFFSSTVNDKNEVEITQDNISNTRTWESVSLDSDGSTEKQKSPREMPWSDFHEWALRDSLPKYTRVLPGATPKIYALWRTMLQDVPELSGYPINFLQRKCAKQPSKTENSSGNIITSNATASMKAVPDVLPYLDNFCFVPSGGLSGQVSIVACLMIVFYSEKNYHPAEIVHSSPVDQVYGVAGLKDGTQIETSPVEQVEVTIPLGYVLTEDAEIAYELGAPLAETDGEGDYSLDGMSRRAGKTAGSLSRSASDGMTTAVGKRGSVWNYESEEDPNSLLIKLGASTGLLLAGATAINILSHHLTVNVFWV